MHDVVVVGAGAIGLYLARLCRGLDVLVVDKASAIGGHTCSGLYSANLQKLLPVRKEWVEHEVEGAVLHSPKGSTIELGKGRVAAYVVDRDRMEQSLAEGVNVRLGTEVKGIEVSEESERVLLATAKGEIESKMVVGCDGAYSVVARHFGVEPQEVVSGLIALSPEQNTASRVELWFDRDVIADGFLWKIPRGSRTEYGMLGTHAKFSMLERFFGLAAYEKRFGFIPIGPAEKTYFDRALLLGNAVGITKPWSGGGIVYGLTCAQIASAVIHKAVKANDFSEAALKEYEAEWKRRISASIRFGMLFRKAYKMSGNDRIDLFFRMFSAARLNRLDMDFPGLGLLS
jgi:geranylgeranyl reductase family protein